MDMILLKLVISAVFGAILGLERESKHKPLGLKTCIVISVASCLLTIISIEAAVTTYNGNPLLRADPMRLAAQIVSGVGFLGAGVILRKNNDSISGLTTAAIVWTASGIGIAVGAGYYYESLISMFLIFVGVKLLPYIMKRIGPKAYHEQGVKISLQLESDVFIQKVIDEIRNLKIKIGDVSILGSKEGHRLSLNCTVPLEKDCVFYYYKKILNLSGVIQVKIEEL
jgi:putative Mg2+ transporter-C (MgtC) family protein